MVGCGFCSAAGGDVEQWFREQHQRRTNRHTWTAFLFTSLHLCTGDRHPYHGRVSTITVNEFLLDLPSLTLCVSGIEPDWPRIATCIMPDWNYLKLSYIGVGLVQKPFFGLRCFGRRSHEEFIASVWCVEGLGWSGSDITC